MAEQKSIRDMADEETENPGYVVVLFGGGADDWCTLSQCPVGIAEWFPTQEAAGAYCDTVPEGFQPHIVSLQRKEYRKSVIEGFLADRDGDGVACDK